MKKKVVHNRVIIQIPELHFFFRYLLSRYFNSGLLPLFLLYKKTAKFQKKSSMKSLFLPLRKILLCKDGKCKLVPAKLQGSELDSSSLEMFALMVK